ncbi:hypothetical protein ACX6XY_13910 [Streptomyces sp. O3]
MSEARRQAPWPGRDPWPDDGPRPGGDGGAPAEPAEPIKPIKPIETTPTAAVLASAASASHAYTAAAAQSAATALVRMFMEQGVFGLDVLTAAEAVEADAEARAGSGSGSGSGAGAGAVVAPTQVPEPTTWERARSAVALAERRRTSGAATREPDVTSVRLMGDIVGSAGPSASVRSLSRGLGAASTARAA